jgi:hypothetical protein
LPSPHLAEKGLPALRVAVNISAVELRA